MSELDYLLPGVHVKVQALALFLLGWRHFIILAESLLGLGLVGSVLEQPLLVGDSVLSQPEGPLGDVRRLQVFDDVSAKPWLLATSSRELPSLRLGLFRHRGK